jgi:hypothetical protein
MIMDTNHGNFMRMPQTRLGWWAVGLSALFTVLFISSLTGLLVFSGMLTIILGIASGILGLIAIIKNHERSWLIWLMLLPGLFAIGLSIAEMLFPY